MNSQERQAMIQGMRLQMQTLGISAEGLTEGSVSRLPTVAEAVANVVERNPYSGRTLKTYRTAWTLFDEMYGPKHLDELTFEDIELVAAAARRQAAERWERRNVPRRERGQRIYDHKGDGAYETCLRALRAVYRREYRKAGRPVEQAPAYHVDIPSRKASGRRPLSREELKIAFDVALGGGDDPILDGLIVRAGYELGARQEGLINLRLMDLDRQRQTATLDEKNDKKREQPISKDLLEALLAIARERGASRPEDAVLRYRPRAGKVGQPLTSRRFDTLCNRLRDSDENLENLHFVG